MGFVSSMFNSSQGAGFQASKPSLETGATTAQADEQYKQAQAALAQQQAFTQALSSQGAQGMGTQTALTQQLQNQAAGVGPNPAQAMLAQQTQANTANQAALMAGQRGSSQNVGLLARQAAQQGAANQQQAVGQGATLQAQQQIAAQQQLQQLAGTQIGQQAGAVSGYSNATQAEQQNVLNSIAQYNNAQANVASSMNAANSNIAAANTAGQWKALSGAASGAGGGAAAGAAPAANAAHGGEVDKEPRVKAANGLMVAPTTLQVAPVPQATPAPTAAQPASKQPQSQAAAHLQDPNAFSFSKDPVEAGFQKAGMGLAKGIKGLFSSSDDSGGSPEDNPGDFSSSDIAADKIAGGVGESNLAGPDALEGLAAAAHGGELKEMYYDEGGDVATKPTQDDLDNATKDVNQEKFFKGLRKAFGNPDGKDDQQAQSKAKGGKINLGSKLKSGGHVPGKAKVAGDNLKNDTVKALLSPGEVVIPRSVMHSQDPVNNAARFVASIMMKKKAKGK